MKKLFAFLYFCLVSTGIFAQGSWMKKSDFGGGNRVDAVGFSIGSKGYIGTGFDPSFSTNWDFWEYDPSNDTWTQKADFGGSARRNAAAFSIGTKGYVGIGYDGSTSFQDFWEYDPSFNTWTQKANFSGTARGGVVSFSIGTKGYLGTGFSGTFYNDFWEYDPSSDTWTQKANLGGSARGNAVGFSIANKGYVGTGWNGVNYLNDFWEYDPSTDSWTQKANFAGAPREFSVGFSSSGFGYVGLGQNSSGKYSDFLEYNPIGNNWIQKSGYSGGLTMMAVGFFIGSKGYIGVGYDSVNSFKNDFWEFNPCTTTPSLCMVTVDSLSQNNVIMWDKTGYQQADSFIVYREVGLNDYQPIGRVPYDSLSLFVDTVRTKYFPNTGDPNAGTYKYKLQIRDSCGGLGPLSPDHNTIFIINNSGTFSWPQLYLIGGVINPVSNYVLMRDNFNNGNWTVVNSVAGSQQTVTDPQYATYQATAAWRVETQWSISCAPSKINPEILSFNSSRSNIFSFTTGVNEYYNNPAVSIYPNPTEGEFTVYSLQSEVNSLEIYDVFGKIVFKTRIISKQQDVNPMLSGGMYFYKIMDASTVMVTGKLIIKN